MCARLLGQDVLDQPHPANPHLVGGPARPDAMTGESFDCAVPDVWTIVPYRGRLRLSNLKRLRGVTGVTVQKVDAALVPVPPPVAHSVLSDLVVMKPSRSGSCAMMRRE